MNIKDYAKDVNLSVAEVLRKCSELGIKADANAILSDDDIIMLDNTINLISTNKETTYEEEDQIDDVIEKVLQSENIDKTDSLVATAKQKLKKKDSNNNEFKNLTKQDVKDYYDKYYTPDNMNLVVTGDVNPDDVIAQLILE